MEITYTDKKNFTKEEVQRLFRSVHWVSGEYPERLHKALMHSSTVITARDGGRLVGLCRVVDPEYHGHGIAGHMIEMVKEKYRNFLYLEVMPEESRNAAFYERFGFRVMQDGVAMQICNFSDRR